MLDYERESVNIFEQEVKIFSRFGDEEARLEAMLVLRPKD